MEYDKKSTETKITRLNNRTISVLFFAVCIAYGSDKNIGQGLDDFAKGIAQTFAVGLLAVTNFFSRDEIETGYAVASVETDETHNLTMPVNAVPAVNIAKRGAHDDGFYLYDSFTNHLERTGLITTNTPWVHTDGTITLKARNLGLPLDGIDFYESYSNVTVYAPRYGKYGFLPGSLWPDYTNSLIWTAVNENGSRVITWQNSLENRLPDYRSFQIEFKQGGEITYRYAPMLGNISTNSIGLYRNAHAQLITAPTNTTSITLSYIGDLSDGTGDTDGDGLSDYDEVKIYYTNPTLADSDGDSLDDGTEVNTGSDPNDPDSDGDGIPDGCDSSWQTHSYFGSSDNYNFAVSISDPPTSDSKAVLLIDSLPLLMVYTNTYYFNLPPKQEFDVTFTSIGNPPLSIEYDFVSSPQMRMRSGSAEEYLWVVLDDPKGLFNGRRNKQAKAKISNLSLELVIEENSHQCVHGPDEKIYYKAIMKPDRWNKVSSIVYDGFEDEGNHRYSLSLDGWGTAKSGTLRVEWLLYDRNKYFQKTIHMCSGTFGYLCERCGTIHDSSNGCSHDDDCEKDVVTAHECTCDAVDLVLNCDDDDNDNVEDRYQNDIMSNNDEDDLYAFSAAHYTDGGNIYGDCCCGLTISNKAAYLKITTISPALRVHNRYGLISEGDMVDYSTVYIEGISAVTNGIVGYEIYNSENQLLCRGRSKYNINPQVTFNFDTIKLRNRPVVVRRLSDGIIHTTNSMTVGISGIAEGKFKLELDRVRLRNSPLSHNPDIILYDGDTEFDIFGETASQQMDDAQISLTTIGGDVLATTNATVLWVDISMRCGQDEAFSDDNDAAIAKTRLKLGTQECGRYYFGNTQYRTFPSMINVAEFRGAISPINFTNEVELVRSYLDVYSRVITDDGRIFHPNDIHFDQIPNLPNDLSEIYYRDFIPSQNGNVYDVDIPGFRKEYLKQHPMNTLAILRANFVAYAYFNNIRCSDYFYWHSNTTIIKTAVAGDNGYQFISRPNKVNENTIGEGLQQIIKEE